VRSRIIRSSTPKARKRYFCDLCSHPIEKGVQYHAQISVCEDGDIGTFKQHLECYNLSQIYFECHNENTAPSEYILDWADGMPIERLLEMVGEAGVVRLRGEG